MTLDTLPAPDPLVGLDRLALGERLGALVTRPYQIKQIYDALYLRGITRFDDMTDLSLALRSALSERFAVGLPDVATQQESADGTTKFLLRLRDGASIESIDQAIERAGTKAGNKGFDSAPSTSTSPKPVVRKPGSMPRILIRYIYSSY